MNLKKLLFTKLFWFFKYKKLNLFMVSVLFITQPTISICELSEESYLLSKLIIRSELVVCGKVDNIMIDKNNYKIIFNIENLLKGDIENRIEIISKLRNGFYIEDEPYLEKSKNYLLFLRKDNNEWIVTNHIAGVYSIDLKDDLIKILSNYNNNQNLFSQNYTYDLINLFNSLNSVKLKTILLCDLKRLLTKDFSSFIENVFESNEKLFKIFGIQESGRLKIESMKEKIENIIISSNDKELIFYGINALGKYRNQNSFNFILPFLTNSDQGIRRVTIEALGSIGGDQIISPLLKLYEEEQDWGNRIAIISSINLLSDRVIVKNTLNLMLKIESHPLVLSILKDTLKK